MAGKKKKGISFGTVFMLSLAAVVVIGFVVFLSAIASDGLYKKAEVLFHSLRDRGVLTEQPEATPDATLRRAGAQATAVPLLVPEITPTPVPEPITFSLTAAGTVQAPKAILQSVQTGKDQYDFTPVFAGLGTTLSEADLAIVTLETAVAGGEKAYGRYNAPAQLLDALRACGTDLVSLATERAFDMGADGLRMTQAELAARGLASAGALSEETAGRTSNLIGIRGVQVAVLAYTYGVSDEGRACTREQDRSVLFQLDMDQIAADITCARVDGADVVIVLPHWGTKNKQETPDALRQMARQMAQAGADIILGTHPNVVLETERLRVTRADGLEYESVVCYSLGSLLTDARAAENTAAAAAHLSVTYDPVSRRVTLGSLACTPVYIAQLRGEAGAEYRIVDTDNAQSLAALSESERQAAQAAAEMVRSVTGQAQREEEGQG